MNVSLGAVKGVHMCHGFDGISTALSVIKHLRVLRHTNIMIQIGMFIKIATMLKKQLVKAACEYGEIVTYMKKQIKQG